MVQKQYKPKYLSDLGWTEETYVEKMGHSIVDYAAYMEKSRRFLLDKIFELHQHGKMNQEIYDEIINAEGNLFEQCFPNSIPVYIKSSTWKNV